MSGPVSIDEAVRQQMASNTERLKRFAEEGTKTDEIRSIALRFEAPEQAAARSIAQAMFAKGARLLTAEPVLVADGLWEVRTSVQHGVIEIAEKEYLTDLVTLAAGMQGSFAGWELLQPESSASPDAATPVAGSPNRKAEEPS